MTFPDIIDSLRAHNAEQVDALVERDLRIAALETQLEYLIGQVDTLNGERGFTDALCIVCDATEYDGEHGIVHKSFCGLQQGREVLPPPEGGKPVSVQERWEAFARASRRCEESATHYWNGPTWEPNEGCGQCGGASRVPRFPGLLQECPCIAVQRGEEADREECEGSGACGPVFDRATLKWTSEWIHGDNCLNCHGSGLVPIAPDLAALIAVTSTDWVNGGYFFDAIVRSIWDAAPTTPEAVMEAALSAVEALIAQETTHG